MLADNYVCSHIHNVVCKDLNQKSYIVELMKTPNLVNFDAMGLQEILGAIRQGINLSFPDTNNFSGARQSNYNTPFFSPKK